MHVQSKDRDVYQLHIRSSFTCCTMCEVQIKTWSKNERWLQFMKNLKIPKGYAESVNRRSSDNTMAKENGQEQPSEKQYT